jgi:hypothetical protein
MDCYQSLDESETSNAGNNYLENSTGKEVQLS